MVDSYPKNITETRKWEQVKGQSVENGQRYLFEEPKIHTQGFKARR